MRALAPYVSEYTWSLPVLVVLGLLSALADGLVVSLVVLFLYVVLGQASQAVESGGPIGEVFRIAESVAGTSSTGLGFLIFGLILFRTLVNFTYDYVTEWVRNRVAEKFRVMVHSQYLDVSYDYILRHDQGDLMNVLGKESWVVMEAYFNIARLATNLCSIAVLGGFVVAASWKIALLAAVGALVIFLVMERFSPLLRRENEKAVEVNNDLYQRMLTTMQAMRTLRAFGREQHTKAAFLVSSTAVRERLMRMSVIYSAVMPIGSIGHLALLGGVIAVSGSLGIASSVALTAMALLYRLQPQIQEMQGIWLHMAGMEPGLRMIRSVLDRADKTFLPEGTLPFSSLRTGIAFDGVGITYRDAPRPSLVDVSFVIPAGKLTALVGPSGSGKTTIINLVLRLYAPDGGTIRVDGVPLFDLARRDWLDRIAVTGQDTELIEGTIVENIRMGRPHLGLEDCREAARIAEILEFIDGTSEGMDTWIGERGLTVSGGQRQRIGLARALAGNPEILVLDEGTNALDVELERLVIGNIRRRMKGRTVISIAHTGAIEAADHVIRIAEGRIVVAGVAAADAPGIARAVGAS